jgi:hypothetical protein
MGDAVESWSCKSVRRPTWIRFEGGSGSIGGGTRLGARSRGRNEISIEGGRDAGEQESGKSTRSRELHAAAADAPSLGSAAS